MDISGSILNICVYRVNYVCWSFSILMQKQQQHLFGKLFS